MCNLLRVSFCVRLKCRWFVFLVVIRSVENAWYQQKLPITLCRMHCIHLKSWKKKIEALYFSVIKLMKNIANSNKWGVNCKREFCFAVEIDQHNLIRKSLFDMFQSFAYYHVANKLFRFEFSRLIYYII